MNEQKHSMTGAWALDALDADERALVEAYLAEDPEAAAEADSFVETAAELAEGLDPAPPPPALKSAVLAEIARTRQLPPVVDPDEAERPRPTSPSTPATPVDEPLVAASAAAPSVPLDRYRASVRRSRLFALAAGVLLATTATGVGLWSTERATNEQARETIEALQSSQSGSAEERAVLESIMTADDAAHTEVPSTTGGTLEVMYSVEQGSMIVTAADLRDLPADHVYQLWLVDEDDRMIASEMLADSSGTLMVQGDMEGVVGVGMTVEPMGGSTQPTSDPIAVGNL